MFDTLNPSQLPPHFFLFTFAPLTKLMGSVTLTLFLNLLGRWSKV
jgi:hypothetical protein